MQKPRMCLHMNITRSFYPKRDAFGRLYGMWITECADCGYRWHVGERVYCSLEPEPDRDSSDDSLAELRAAD